MQWWNERRSMSAGAARRMELLETLSLGGNRQLMLVRCGGERFLVGGSPDCIQNIVKIESDDAETVRQDGVCR